MTGQYNFLAKKWKTGTSEVITVPTFIASKLKEGRYYQFRIDLDKSLKGGPENAENRKPENQKTNNGKHNTETSTAATTKDM